MVYTDFPSKLSEVLSNGKLDMVDYLLRHGANVNHVDRSGETALMKAVIQCQLDMVKYLIRQDADMNKMNKHGETALTLAARGSRWYRPNLDIIYLLLRADPTINGSLR